MPRATGGSGEALRDHYGTESRFGLGRASLTSTAVDSRKARAGGGVVALACARIHGVLLVLLEAAAALDSFSFVPSSGILKLNKKSPSVKIRQILLGLFICSADGLHDHLLIYEVYIIYILLILRWRSEPINRNNWYPEYFMKGRHQSKQWQWQAEAKTRNTAHDCRTRLPIAEILSQQLNRRRSLASQLQALAALGVTHVGG